MTTHSIDHSQASKPVCEAKIVITVLGKAESPESFAQSLTDMSYETLASAMKNGDLIGGHQIASTIEVPADQVRDRLLNVGDDGSFFSDHEQGLSPD